MNVVMSSEDISARGISSAIVDLYTIRHDMGAMTLAQVATAPGSVGCPDPSWPAG